MGITQANGRNLEPVNLHSEVFIRFNSPPFHVLKREFIPRVAAKWRKEFHRRGKKTSWLKLDEFSHSLESFRRREVKSHIPINMFKC